MKSDYFLTKRGGGENTLKQALHLALFIKSSHNKNINNLASTLSEVIYG